MDITGKDISHLCHNKLCVRGEHLSAEPHAVNNARQKCVVICSNSLRLILENVDFLGVWQCKCKVFFGVCGVGVGGGGKFSSLHFL